TGVTVHVVCPGYVRTEFHQRAGIKIKFMPPLMWLQVDDVVRECLAGVAKGKVVIVPGLQYKAMTGALRMAPRPVMRFFTRTFGQGRGRT
ncbi:MAG: short-chain dehydrogenase, partial [Mycolicibacterium sp.]|nr:short-chain dehydrogenase [Mycolicibacterium sp.]